MRNIIIIILALFVLSSPVFALDILSIDKVDYTSNDYEVGGPAILLTGVENGISESAYYEFKDAEESLPEDLAVRGSGLIRSELKDYRLSYPILNTGDEFFSISQVCDGDDCTFSHDMEKALDQCRDIVGEDTLMFVDKWNYYKQYRCFEAQPDATLGTFENYETMWEQEFTAEDENGAVFDTVTLTEQETVHEGELFQVRYSFMGGSGTGVPQPADNYKAAYSTKDNSWHLIKESVDETQFHYPSTLDKFDDCLNSLTITKSLDETYQFCIDEVNSEVSLALNPQEYQGYNADLETEGEDGRLILSGIDDIYEYPVFKMKINAETVGIYAPAGDPSIVSFEAGESEFTEGQSAYFVSEVTNEADVEASFNYQFDCDDAYVSPVNFEGFRAGQTKTKKHYVTGETESVTEATCELTVVDTANSANTDSETASIKFVDSNTCDDVGTQRCTADGTIQECSRVDGTKVWTNIKNCPGGCKITGDTAMCEDNPDEPDCGDGYCHPKEKNVDSEYYCPSDCNPKQDTTILWIIGGTLGVIGLMYVLSQQKKGKGGNGALKL